MAVGSLLPSASADGLKGLEAKPLPLWALTPLWIIFKGVKTHIGTSKAEQSSIRLLKQTAKESLRTPSILYTGKSSFLVQICQNMSLIDANIILTRMTRITRIRKYVSGV